MRIHKLGTLNLLFYTLLVSACAEQRLTASTILSGTLLTDDDLRTFFFQVPDESTITIRTYGYAGGATLNGDVVASGGFDPFLTLFLFPGGTLLATNDDDPNASIDPITGQGLDSIIEQDLVPASYLVVLSQYGNAPSGPRLARFSQQGNPMFTADPSFALGDPCPTALFRDSTGGDGRCRNGNYTIEFNDALAITETYSQVAAPPNQTPEPNSSIMLLGAAICWIITKLYRRWGDCRGTQLEENQETTQHNRYDELALEAEV